MEIAFSTNKQFENAQNKMQEFLYSNVFTSKDPNKLNQEKLVKINKLGFLTTMIQYGNEIKRDHAKLYSTHIEDRAYICGFMQNSCVDRFLKQIKLNPNIIAYKKIVTYIKSSTMIPLSLDNKKIVTNDKPTITPRKLNLLKKISLLEGVDNISLVYCIDIKFNRLANSQYGLFNNVIDTLEKL